MARIVRVIASFLCLGFALVTMPVAVAAAPLQYSNTADYQTATTRSTAIAVAPTTMTSTTTTRAYAQREAQHPQSAAFRGGDSLGIYIGGSAGLVIVVLLVLLLLR
jgi:hypothetical protein